MWLVLETLAQSSPEKGLQKDFRLTRKIQICMAKEQMEKCNALSRVDRYIQSKSLMTKNQTRPKKWSEFKRLEEKLPFLIIQDET